MSPLIRRVAGRRAVRLPTKEKVLRLWKATHALYEHDPEHFQGGCADISIALYFAAARANWTGVQVVTGVADPPPVYPELDDAREVLERLWEERAETLVQGACKFGALLAYQVYGGEIEATEEHAWVRTDPKPRGWGIIDLPGPPYEGFVYKPDRAFMRRPEWKESLDTCATRVKRWVNELPVEDPGGPFLHVWLSVDGHRLDPTWGLRMDITNVQYQPEVAGREGLREAIDRHGCEMMFEDREMMIYHTDPAMPALRGEV